MAVPPRYRLAHAAVAAVAGFAVVYQLGLILQGHGVLDDVSPPPMGVRIERLVSYFTIQSNLLVALTSGALAAGVGAERRWARVLRLDALVAITVTGVIHWFLLRPLLELEGPDLVADQLLHVVVPLLALLGWLLATPAGWLRRADLPLVAVYPALYVAYTLVHGAARDWYPYPFIDVLDLGYPRALLHGAGVVLLMLVLAVLFVGLDRHVPLVRRRAVRTA